MRDNAARSAIARFPDQDIQILILDDSRQELQLMRHVMEDLGVPYPVQYFDRAFSLLAFLDRQRDQRGPASLIFTDWRLNQAISESDNLQLILAHPVGQLCPVAVMSNSLTDVEKTQCYQMGANHVFDKPADYATLLQRIRTVLEVELLLE
jgi:CheY-like chemotaxis protein